MMKTCGKCKQNKPFSEFRKAQPGKGDKNGLFSQCRDCVRVYRKSHYQNNKQQYADNYRRWCQKNPDAVRAYSLNRYTLKKEASGKITPDVISLVFETYGKVCLKCGSIDRIEIDHIVPLTRGGSNEFDNLQPLCKPCNLDKSNRTEADYRFQGEGRTTS